MAHCLVPDLKEQTFRLSLLYNVSTELVIYGFIILRYVPYLPDLLYFTMSES